MKKWTQILTLVLGLCGLIFSVPGRAQSKQTQLQCRAKAKEAAKISYDQCLSVAKIDEAESIRQEYKAKLAKLKAFYEQKLKKLNLKTKTEVKTATTTTAPATEISSALPKKADTGKSTTETAGATFSPPTPVNTQETIAAPAQEATATSESLPPDSNEPTIRLKEAPAPADNQPLEVAPELTI